MPRKFAKRRRPFKVRRRTRRVMRPGRPVRSSLNCHRFKRECNLGPLTIYGGGNGYSGFGIKFQFDNLPNYQEFTNLYDQYRIDRISLRFVARTNTVTVMEGLNHSVGSIQGIFCTDHDDAAGPASSEAGWNEMRERVKSRTHIFGMNQVFKHKLVPAIASEVYKTALTTAYAPKFHQRLDVAFPDIPHFGVKGLLRLPLTTGVVPIGLDIPIDVYASYYFTMFDVR